MSHVIEEPLATILERLHSGWSPLAFGLGKVVKAELGERLIEGELALRRDDQAFEERLVFCRREKGTVSGFESTEAQRLKVDFADGTELVAARVFPSAQYLDGKDIVVTEWVALDWTVSRPNTQSYVWVAPIDRFRGDLLPGNLTIGFEPMQGRRGRRQSFGHLAFERTGGHLLFVWSGRVRKSWHAVVTGPEPTSDELRDLVIKTQFVMGRPFRIGALRAVDKQGETTATTYGLRIPFSGTTINARPPVSDADGVAWLGRLFAKIQAGAPAHSRKGVAIYRYVEAMGGPLDSQYVLLRVSLEGLAREILQERGGMAPKHIYGETGFGNDAAAVEKPNETANAGRSRVSGSQIIGLAFKLVDLELSDELRAELDDSDEVLARGVISPPDSEGFADVLARVDTMRACYLGLLCRAIGFDGPLVGFKIRHGLPASWASDSRDPGQDLVLLVAMSKGHSNFTPRSLWPDFSLPELVSNPLLSRVRQFTESLKDLTGQRVVAKLVPSWSGESTAYQILLAVRERPEVQAALGHIEVRDAELMAQLLDWKVITIRDEGQLDETLRKLAHSQFVEAQVTRMMAFARAQE